ncbi:glucose 1-dehydrogenase [Paenibacillus monticola]
MVFTFMLLAGKVCIITGGASGIGEIMAKRFAEEGAIIVIADIDGQAGQRVALEIGSAQGSQVAYSFQLDVSSESEVQALVTDIMNQHGRLDVLVNNAATILPKPLEEVSEPEWTRLMNINLKSVYLMTKHTIGLLRQTKGNIVNMASLNGLIGQKQNAAYAATKGAMIALTKSLALDYAVDGVRVNCICPAGVSTPLLEKWIQEQDDPVRARTALNDMHPLGRPALPEEVADAALFMASGLARFVTGVALPVDGGASLGY